MLRTPLIPATLEVEILGSIVNTDDLKQGHKGSQYRHTRTKTLFRSTWMWRHNQYASIVLINNSWPVLVSPVPTAPSWESPTAYCLSDFLPPSLIFIILWACLKKKNEEVLLKLLDLVSDCPGNWSMPKEAERSQKKKKRKKCIDPTVG